VRAVIFDARPLPGGLNTYGVAEYKLPLRESLREIDMLAQLGVEFHFDITVDAAQLTELEAAYDAIFLGVGLGAIHRLGIGGEQRQGVTNALDFIAGYKSGAITTVPGRVAVIGAGNTAIDAAIAALRLGANEVHMVYRRGPEQMSAFAFEYRHARQEGVNFLWNATPVGFAGEERVRGLHLARMESREDGSLVPNDGDRFTLPADLVVLAIGQAAHTDFLTGGKVKLERGRIVIDRATGQTTDPRYFAGGDCTNGGREVVDAVADGKRAGIAMAAWLDAVAQEAQHAHA
jgi:glutamate synthase (NADPH/NADH) small chain